MENNNTVKLSEGDEINIHQIRNIRNEFQEKMNGMPNWIVLMFSAICQQINLAEMFINRIISGNGTPNDYKELRYLIYKILHYLPSLRQNIDFNYKKKINQNKKEKIKEEPAKLYIDERDR
jgi:hypothetical protein